MIPVPRMISTRQVRSVLQFGATVLHVGVAGDPICAGDLVCAALRSGSSGSYSGSVNNL